MKTNFEAVELSVKTKKNRIPTSKAVTGRFHMSPDCEKAFFSEEENASVIIGEAKTRRLFRRNTCSVRYNEDDEEYVIRIRVKTSRPGYDLMAECDFEECINYIRAKHYEEKTIE